MRKGKLKAKMYYKKYIEGNIEYFNNPNGWNIYPGLVTGIIRSGMLDRPSDKELRRVMMAFLLAYRKMYREVATPKPFVYGICQLMAEEITKRVIPTTTTTAFNIVTRIANGAYPINDVIGGGDPWAGKPLVARKRLLQLLIRVMEEEITYHDNH